MGHRCRRLRRRLDHQPRRPRPRRASSTCYALDRDGTTQADERYLYYDVDGNGVASDDERDEDADGLTNHDEVHGPASPDYWAGLLRARRLSRSPTPAPRSTTPTPTATASATAPTTRTTTTCRTSWSSAATWPATGRLQAECGGTAEARTRARRPGRGCSRSTRACRTSGPRRASGTRPLKGGYAPFLAELGPADPQLSRCSRGPARVRALRPRLCGGRRARERDLELRVRPASGARRSSARSAGSASRAARRRRRCRARSAAGCRAKPTGASCRRRACRGSRGRPRRDACPRDLDAERGRDRPSVTPAQATSASSSMSPEHSERAVAAGRRVQAGLDERAAGLDRAGDARRRARRAASA